MAYEENERRRAEFDYWQATNPNRGKRPQNLRYVPYEEAEYWRQQALPKVDLFAYEKGKKVEEVVVSPPKRSRAQMRYSRVVRTFKSRIYRRNFCHARPGLRHARY